MAKILLAEDDRDICLLLKSKLAGLYDISTVSNGQQALAYIEGNAVDMLISDVMMPIMDGFTLVKTLRQDGYDFPIIMLTAKETIRDKTIGFTSGVDDYITKPVNLDELVLRIAALMRRAKIQSSRVIKIGETSINETTLLVQKDSITVELANKEFALLFKLLSYPNQVFTTGQLFDEIWGLDSDSNEDTVKTHISRLRKKLSDFKDDFEIQTVRGLGYRGILHHEKK